MHEFVVQCVDERLLRCRVALALEVDSAHRNGHGTPGFSVGKFMASRRPGGITCAPLR